MAENNIKLFLSACCNDFLTGIVWIKAYEQAIIKQLMQWKNIGRKIVFVNEQFKKILAK